MGGFVCIIINNVLINNVIKILLFVFYIYNLFYKGINKIYIILINIWFNWDVIVFWLVVF